MWCVRVKDNAEWRRVSIVDGLYAFVRPGREGAQPPLRFADRESAEAFLSLVSRHFPDELFLVEKLK